MSPVPHPASSKRPRCVAVGYNHTALEFGHDDYLHGFIRNRHKLVGACEVDAVLRILARPLNDVVVIGTVLGQLVQHGLYHALLILAVFSRVVLLEKRQGGFEHYILRPF